MKANFFDAPTPVSRSPKPEGGREGRGRKRVELTDGSAKLTTTLDTTLGRIESAREEERSDDAMIQQNETDGTDRTNGIVAAMDETGEVMM